MSNTKKAASLLQDFAQRFSEKEFPDKCAKTFISAPDLPSSSWSLGNRILMMFGETSDARGFRQWQKAGRYVKKGAKAMYILVPMHKKITDKETDEERTVIVGFRGAPVFRYEDTEGAALKEYKPRALPPLYGLAKKNNVDIQWKSSGHGEYGSMSIDGKRMTLSTESPDTFLHELMHLYDGKQNKLVGGQDPVQETVAQLGACVLAKLYGYDVEDYTWNYISAYADSKNPQEIGAMCFKTLGRVQKVIDAILSDAESLGSEQVIEVKSK